MLKRWLEPQRAAFALAGGILAISLVYRPGRMMPFSFCAFRHLTGLPCAMCGMTRSFCALAKGDFLESLHAHPAGPLLFAATVGIFAAGFQDVFAEQSVLCKFGRAAQLDRVRTWLFLIGALWTVKFAAVAFLGWPV